jgi:hypothetical protein
MAASDLSFLSGFFAATGVFWSIGGMIWLSACLRRLAMIRIRFTGVPTRGEVIGMVVCSDANGTVLNSPQVRYFSPDGPPVVTHAYGYRNRQLVVTGAQVRLWYDPLRPERILVSRFDLRIRDFVACTGAVLVTAAGIALEIAAFTIK